MSTPTPDPTAGEGLSEAAEWRTEWRVVGDPSEDYPTYRYTFASEPEARGFIALVTSDANAWDFGPFLERRRVAETPWSRLAPDTAGESA